MPDKSLVPLLRLTTATIMIGPQSLGLTLNQQDHAIALVKNLLFTKRTSFVNLTQGVTNAVVASMINKESVKISADEMIATNLASGLGFDATAKHQTFGVKIIGIDATTKRLRGIYIPRAQITMNFAIGFAAENSSRTLGIEPFKPVPSDPGYSTDFVDLFTVFTPEDAS